MDRFKENLFADCLHDLVYRDFFYYRIRRLHFLDCTTNEISHVVHGFLDFNIRYDLLYKIIVDNNFSEDFNSFRADLYDVYYQKYCSDYDLDDYIID